jgi:hypothetical protein
MNQHALEEFASAEVRELQLQYKWHQIARFSQSTVQAYASHRPRCASRDQTKPPGPLTASE